MFYHSLLHRRQFRYLGAFYLHSIIRSFAISLFQLFNGIFIFQLARNYGFEFHQSLSIVAFSLALIHIFNSLSAAPSVWLIAKKGLRFAVLWGNLSLVAFYVILSLAKYDLIFLFIATFFGGAAIGLYWTAYHLYFSHLSDDKKQGEEISIGSLLASIASIGGPAFGGLLINFLGFEALFVVLAILVLVATIPLQYLPKQEDKIEVHLLKIIMTLSPKREWKTFLTLGGIAFTDEVAVVFLPIFFLPFLSGIIGVGFIGSVLAFFAMVMTFIVGFMIDRFGPKRVINVIAPLDAITWVISVFITSASHIFLLSPLYALNRSAQNISVDTAIYQHGRHQDIVAAIFQREIGMAIMRWTLFLVWGILFWFNMPLVLIFLFTALVSLLTKLYPYKTDTDKAKINLFKNDRPDNITS